MSLFASVEMAPRDPILGVTEQYLADPRPNKVNLGVGVYSDDKGRLPELEAVQQVEQALLRQHPLYHYLPIDGLPAYTAATRELLFGADSPLLECGRVITAQTLGGSGALRVGADLLKVVLGDKAVVAISDPSWGNHYALFRAAGFTLLDYRYYDAATHGLDFPGMLEDLGRLAPGSVVLLHACCHNPTGVDLKPEQWTQVAALMKERALLPFVDMAYQGFHRGISEDAMAIRFLVDAGVENLLVANSYSKNFSLYGERVGALSFVGRDHNESERVRSKVKQIIRATYSSPPTHGASLVAGVLASDELRALWKKELAQMCARIQSMRARLIDRLAALGAPDFSFINHQTGMFSYSGLGKAQVERLRQDNAIYAVSSGRICIAALTSSNLEHVAQSLAALFRQK